MTFAQGQIHQLLKRQTLQQPRIKGMGESGAMDKIDPDDRGRIRQIIRNVAYLKFDWKLSQQQTGEYGFFQGRGGSHRIEQMSLEFVTKTVVTFAIVGALLQAVAGNGVGFFVIPRAIPGKQGRGQKPGADTRSGCFAGASAVPFQHVDQALGQITCLMAVEQAQQADFGCQLQLFQGNGRFDFPCQPVNDGRFFITQNPADFLIDLQTIVGSQQAADIKTLF
ncbi:hypothetical protein I4N56_012505 [Pseudomonas mohnii]|nr:hypothetical protein [Pseudomonas mohnii]